MSKKKTDMEMREIAEMIKNMVKDWNEAETEDKENYPNNNCEDCEYWDEDCDCCDGDCEEEEEEEENTQIADLSKFIMSVNTVLGGDMGMLIFDKSNKKDMEKIAAIFGEYARRLS